MCAQALGVSVELGPEEIAQCLEETNIAFMFAPRFHPAMKAVIPVRKSLKVRRGQTRFQPPLPRRKGRQASPPYPPKSPLTEWLKPDGHGLPTPQRCAPHSTS